MNFNAAHPCSCGCLVFFPRHPYTRQPASHFALNSPTCVMRLRGLLRWHNVRHHHSGCVLAPHSFVAAPAAASERTNADALRLPPYSPPPPSWGHRLCTVILSAPRVRNIARWRGAPGPCGHRLSACRGAMIRGWMLRHPQVPTLPPSGRTRTGSMLWPGDLRESKKKAPGPPQRAQHCIPARGSWGGPWAEPSSNPLLQRLCCSLYHRRTATPEERTRHL